MRITCLLALLAGGCATVGSHQRSRLLTPVMTADSNPLEASSMEHVLRIREEMIGATGVGGASCGCG